MVIDKIVASLWEKKSIFFINLNLIQCVEFLEFFSSGFLAFNHLCGVNNFMSVFEQKITHILAENLAHNLIFCKRMNKKKKIFLLLLIEALSNIKNEKSVTICDSPKKYRISNLLANRTGRMENIQFLFSFDAFNFFV